MFQRRVLCYILLSVTFCAVLGTAKLSAKAFYCRDPDTGKFYPVNATWSSTTFCGSYTCKIRRLNPTVSNYPIRQINISDIDPKYVPSVLKQKMKVLPLKNETSIQIDSEENKLQRTRSQDLQDSSKEFSEKERALSNVKKKTAPVHTNQPHNMNESHGGNNITVTNKTMTPNDNRHELQSNNNQSSEQLKKDTKLFNFTKEFEKLKKSIAHENDRYLSADEIKTLTTLLRNVKKSDLEAVLEVYNLAQDIYREIDKSAEVYISKEQQSGKGRDVSKFNNINSRRESQSYWYEPLTHTNPKQKVVQVDTSNLVPVLPPDTLRDLRTAIPTQFVLKKPTIEDISQPIEVNINKEIEPNEQKQNYLMGPFLNNRFRKLPFYYPQTPDTPRHLSYLQPQDYFGRNRMTSKTIPTNIYIENYPSIVNDRTHRIPYSAENFQNPNGKRPQTDVYDKQEMKMSKGKISILDNTRTLLAPFSSIKKSPTMLPYPFAYIHYNLSSLPTYNINNPVFPWQPPVINFKPQNLHDIAKDSKSKYWFPNVVLINPVLGEDMEKFKGAIERSSSHIVTSEEKIPAWQTAPLSESVLEEVKANIATKTKLLPIPIRKKVKLERVGKVIDINPKRTRRQVRVRGRRLKREAILEEDREEIKKRVEASQSQRTKREVMEEEKVRDTEVTKEDALKRQKRIPRDLLKPPEVASSEVKQEGNLEKAEIPEEFEVYLEKSTCGLDTRPGFFRIGNLTQPFPACCPIRIPLP